jgi:hypothetical protein
MACRWGAGKQEQDQSACSREPAQEQRIKGKRAVVLSQHSAQLSSAGQCGAAQLSHMLVVFRTVWLPSTCAQHCTLTETTGVDIDVILQRPAAVLVDVKQEEGIQTHAQGRYTDGEHHLTRHWARSKYLSLRSC